MKKALLGLILGALAVVFVISSIASAGWVEKTLLYDDIRITLDGREIKPCDVNGNYIEPFIIEGTTYLPVRGVASSLGLGVDWNGDTNTVILEGDNTDFKSVLYDENGIKIAYNGIENTENGIAMNFFVQNDSEDDISFDITDISVNDKILKKHLEYSIYSGKKLNILLNLDGIESTEKIKFFFTVFNMYSQKDICDKMEVTADSVMAEAKKYTVPPFEVTGEVTRETFVEFFKSHGKLNNLNGRLSIESTFADLDKGTIQSIMIGYSAASNDFLLETVAAKEVYDPVIEKMVIVPITMDFTIGQNKELYKYEMSIIMNQELVIEIQGEISASDGSVKVVSKRYKNYGGGTGEVYVEKYGSYINKIDPDYITPEVQDEMHDIIQSVSVELVNTFVTESKKIFDEKAPGLSLEFFGLK